jgi:outer membrane receptor protein involved in Fe transport
MVKGVLLVSAATLIMAGSALAQAAAHRFDIPAQDAVTGLQAFARQSGKTVLFPFDAVRGKRTPAVTGNRPDAEVLAQLAAAAGLVVSSDDGKTITLRPGPQGEAAADSAVFVEQLVVTGSRIRGAPPASPVTTITSTEMRNAAQHDLGEVIRAIPQNFAGGQNPTVGGRSGASSANGNGASTLNLRGIGNDATLTLLNGHRPSTNGLSGTDVTAIPLAAVERLEVLTDGASALYGSDAVGGVANVITKRSFNGINTTALYGASTDGGYEQQQYSLVGGADWSGGGGLIALSSTANTQVNADQRSYTPTMNPASNLIGDQGRFNAFASAHQEVGSNIRLAVDALYSNTHSTIKSATTAGPLTSGASIRTPTSRSFLLAPSIEISLPHDWLMTSYATYGEDTARSNGRNLSAVRPTSYTTICYCNKTTSLEVSSEGPLWRGSAGETRLALGAGYRASETYFTGTTNGVIDTVPFNKRDSVSYAFGELSLPVIGPSQDIFLVDSLLFTGAVRYEDYETFGSVATPKFGMIYKVAPSLTLKASWGKSFKAPTMTQRYARNQALLNDVSGYGTLFPAGSTILRFTGGNPDLKPERATSSTVTIEYKPEHVPGLRVGLSYFDIDFKDRVVAPITTLAGALTNPLYRDLLTFNPSMALQAATIAKAPAGLEFSTSQPYNPSRVVAVMDARQTNASQQTIEGFDVSASYRWETQGGDSVSLSTASSYLDIVQERLAGDLSVGITGNFYQPRHFQSRSGISWTHGDATLAGYVSYVGPARYRSVSPILDVKPITTADFVAVWRARRLADTTFTLAAKNALNAKPSIVPGAVVDLSYDSTVYSAVGRFVSLTVSKTW